MKKMTDMMPLTRLIRDLSEARGAGGFEEEVSAILERCGSAFGACGRDAIGNVYLKRNGNQGGRLKVVLDAHQDELAFMVRGFTPDGKLELCPLGSWSMNSFLAQRMEVRSRDGEWIPGVTASLPPHYMTSATPRSAAEAEDTLLDIGAETAAEAQEYFGIRLGAPVVPKVSFREENGLLEGKAFDCRLGCAAILRTLELLQDEELQVDVIAAFTTQEEIGGRGAPVAALKIEPDLALVYEGAPADDAIVPMDQRRTFLGKGPMLRHLDARMLSHPRLQRFALDLAKEKGIPVQEGVRRGGSTNGAFYHTNVKAAPAIVLGVPSRYAHAPIGLGRLEDVENTARLAADILRRLPADILPPPISFD